MKYALIIWITSNVGIPNAGLATIYPMDLTRCEQALKQLTNKSSRIGGECIEIGYRT